VFLLYFFIQIRRELLSLCCVEVASLGAVVRYVDSQGEPHDAVIVKHIDEKSDSILVDNKSHRRLVVGSFSIFFVF